MGKPLILTTARRLRRLRLSMFLDTHRPAAALVHSSHFISQQTGTSWTTHTQLRSGGIMQESLRLLCREIILSSMTISSIITYSHLKYRSCRIYQNGSRKSRLWSSSIVRRVRSIHRMLETSPMSKNGRRANLFEWSRKICAKDIEGQTWK